MGHKYQQKVIIGTDESGKPIVKWAVGDTQKDFQEAIYRILSKVRHPENEETVEGNRFGEYALEWMENFKKPLLRGNTYSQYRSKLKIILDAFGEKEISSITQKDIQVFLNGMESRAESYVRDVLNILRQIFDAAIDDDLVRKNPARSKRIVNPSKTRYERRALTESERRQIANGFSSVERRDDRLYLAFLFYGGMRPGEVLGLRWEDIDRANGVIRIRQAVATYGNGGVIGSTKTAAGKRDIPLVPQLAVLLEPFGSKGMIFSKEDGSPYTGQMRKRMWERISGQLELSGITPYNLRHTMATMLREAEVDIKATQSIMGHANAKITLDIYSHLTARQIDAAGEKIQRVFEGIVG